VEADDLRSLLTDEVIKRELIDGDEAKSASGFLKKLQRRMNAKRSGSDDEEDDSDHSAPPPQMPADSPTNTSATSSDKTSVPGKSQVQTFRLVSLKVSWRATAISRAAMCGRWRSGCGSAVASQVVANVRFRGNSAAD